MIIYSSSMDHSSVSPFSICLYVVWLCLHNLLNWGPLGPHPHILYDSTVPSPSSSSTPTMDPRNKHPSNLRSHCKLGLLRMICECTWVSEWVSEWMSEWMSEWVCVSCVCVCVCVCVVNDQAPSRLLFRRVRSVWWWLLVSTSVPVSSDYGHQLMLCSIM